MSGSKEFTLTAVGDMMFYGPQAEHMAAADDLLWGFRPLKDALLQGDMLFGNFETPISIARQPAPGAPDKYFSPPGMARALRAYGFDVVNLAHNHIYDFGAEGVEATIAEITDAGLPYVGIGRDADQAARPVIVTSRNGVKVGFLAYTTAHNALREQNEYVACFPKPQRVARDVERLASEVDTVVVSCHTGAQYNPYPAPETRELARAAIEAGAAAFLGHHPHVPQGSERIGRGLAVYSLGDFVAPVHNEQTRRTFFARLRVAGNVVSDYETVPCYITDDCQTTLAEGELRKEIIEHLTAITSDIAVGRSDDLHFETARGRFFSQYVGSWRRELRQGGLKMLWRKIRNLRWYHVQLIGRILVGRLRRHGRENRSAD